MPKEQTMDEAKVIAGKLTEAQRTAIMSLGRHIGIRHGSGKLEKSYRGIAPRTFNALVDKGLAWGRENYSSRCGGLLIAGMAVRAILQQEQGQ